jgi:hypothetical protein
MRKVTSSPGLSFTGCGKLVLPLIAYTVFLTVPWTMASCASL